MNEHVEHVLIRDRSCYLSRAQKCARFSSCFNERVAPVSKIQASARLSTSVTSGIACPRSCHIALSFLPSQQCQVRHYDCSRPRSPPRDRTTGCTLLQGPEQVSDKKDAITCALYLRLSPFAHILVAFLDSISLPPGMFTTFCPNKKGYTFVYPFVPD
jgi:hypothetical protein